MKIIGMQWSGSRLAPSNAIQVAMLWQVEYDLQRNRQDAVSFCVPARSQVLATGPSAEIRVK